MLITHTFPLQILKWCSNRLRMQNRLKTSVSFRWISIRLWRDPRYCAFTFSFRGRRTLLSLHLEEKGPPVAHGPPTTRELRSLGSIYFSSSHVELWMKERKGRKNKDKSLITKMIFFQQGHKLEERKGDGTGRHSWMGHTWSVCSVCSVEGSWKV